MSDLTQSHSALPSSAAAVTPEAAPLSQMLLNVFVFDQRLLLTAGAGVVSLLVVYLAGESI